MREVRKRKMIAKQKKTQKNVLNGHGRYMELSDQKEFFEACREQGTGTTPRSPMHSDEIIAQCDDA